MQTTSVRRQTLMAVLVALPVVIFVGLRLNPDVDPMWDLQIFHFYIVSITSLIALAVASFVLSGIGTEDGTRALHVAIGFVSIAGLFVVHGISTPGVIFVGFNQAVGWSARLSLTVGAVFIALALREKRAATPGWLVRRPWRLWVALGVAYIIYLLIAFVFPAPLEVLSQILVVSAAVAFITAALFLWGAVRAWRLYLREPSRLLFVLGFALPWLAVAQISQFSAPTWTASWWLYHMLMLSAFVVTMVALVAEYEQIFEFRLTRYFTVLSLTLGVPIAVVLSEAVVRLTGSQEARWPLAGITLLLVGVLYVALLVVVMRAQRIIDERTAALQAEKLLRADFTNWVVHDLKSPLTVILTGLSLVLSGQVGEVSGAHRERLKRVERSSKELLNLVNTLLDVETMEAGALNLALERVEVGKFLQASVDRQRALVDAHGIQLDLHLPASLPELALDETLVQRVIQNLIDNAVKFTPVEGQIWVEAAAVNGEVQVSVVDSGPGVPQSEQERIFEKFAQVQGVRRRGSGLGLTFCKLVVEAHQGRIWVEDVPEGGSRFMFSLPLNAKGR